MPKSKSRKKKPPKRVLALPDLEHAKTAVLNSPGVLRIGVTPRKLADARARKAASRNDDAVEPARVTGPSDGRHVDWLRPTPR